MGGRGGSLGRSHGTTAAAPVAAATQQYAQAIGPGAQAAATQQYAQPAGPDASEVFQTLDQQQWADFQQRMRQSPTDTYDYAGTSKSFLVNGFLETGTMAGARQRTKNWPGLSQLQIQSIIRRMDAAMKPLPKGIQLTRFCTADQFKAWTGVDVSKAVAGGAAFQAAKAAMEGQVYPSKAYQSASYDIGQNAFVDRPVKLNMNFRKGAKALFPYNPRGEAEVVGARNQKNLFSQVRLVKNTIKGKTYQQIEIDVYIG